MKLRHIAIAAAAVAAAVSANAAGLSTVDQNTLKATMTAGRYVSIAGASAVQAGFEALIASVLNNPVFYVDTSNAAGANYIAVSGTLKNAVGGLNTTNQVVIHYRVAGGSYNGIYPVARSLAIDALDVTNCSSTLGLGTAASPYVCTTRGPNSTSTNKVGLIPDAGISDVAPEFFTVTDNLEGETLPTALSNAEVSSMTTTPLYVQGFGIPLSRTVQSSLVMTKPLYSAIMTGAYSDWNQLPGASATADKGPLVICRRIAGSGTQAVTNLFAGNTGCTAASVPTADRAASGAYATVGGVRSYVASRVALATGANNTGLIVVENNTSGDVRKCLDAAYYGGTYTTADRDSKTQLTVDFGAGGYKAIGVLSMDSVGRSTNTLVNSGATLGNANGTWQFRALNGTGKITGDGITAANIASPVAPVASGTGILPTLANIQTGDWAMQGYESFNVRNSDSGTDKQGVVQAVANAAQSAAVLRGIANLSWASLALPDFVTGNTTAAADASNVVQAAHASNDQCAPLQRQY